MSPQGLTQPYLTGAPHLVQYQCPDEAGAKGISINHSFKDLLKDFDETHAAELQRNCCSTSRTVQRLWPLLKSSPRANMALWGATQPCCLRVCFDPLPTAHSELKRPLGSQAAAPCHAAWCAHGNKNLCSTAAGTPINQKDTQHASQNSPQSQSLTKT